MIYLVSFCWQKMVDNSEAIRATVLDLKAMKRVTYENQWAME